MKLLDFLNAEKRIYAKLTPLTPQKQVPIFPYLRFFFALSVRQLWSCFPTLADGAFQVLGQLEYFNQRDELLFGELVIINTKGSEERTDLLFLGTALKIHRILQLPLYGCYEGAFIRSHGVGAMLLSNVTEDTFQIICNQASEILVLSDLRDFQCPQVQIIFLAAVFHQRHLPDGFQHGVHVVNPHIRDPVDVNLSIQHKPLEIFMADQLRQQPVIELARFQHFDCIITQVQSVQLCVWVIFLFCQPQQVIGGHAVELCQLHHTERADVLEIVGFVFSQRGP